REGRQEGGGQESEEERRHDRHHAQEGHRRPSSPSSWEKGAEGQKGAEARLLPVAERQEQEQAVLVQQRAPAIGRRPFAISEWWARELSHTRARTTAWVKVRA